MTKEERKEYNRQYREKNKDYHKEYYETNKSKYKEYYQENKEEIKSKSKKRNRTEYQRKYRYERIHNDSMFKIIVYIRDRTRNAIKNTNIRKNNSTLKMLGCDKITLMEHLQQTAIQYDSNFNIYDYDSTLYHIDHIKTFEDMLKGIYTLDEICHYTNLQILPAEMNLSKGGNSW